MTADPEAVAALGRYSTPTILNGMKRLGLAPADIESMDRHLVSCMSPQLGARVGFVITRTVATRRSGPPADRARAAECNRKADTVLAALPGPRIVVAENVGDWEGPVAIWGDVMAHVNLAYDIRAGITNGPVRDLPEMSAVGFATFAGGVDVGGGHVEMIAVGDPVTVGGMSVRTGDILHGDVHGVVKVPPEFVDELPGAIDAHERYEQRVIALCQSPDFSSDALERTLARPD